MRRRKTAPVRTRIACWSGVWLSAEELVIHNQDNREHDLLDSDDYYQFEGGAGRNDRALCLGRGSAQIYHNDHSRPESDQCIRTLEGRDRPRRSIGAWCQPESGSDGVMRHGYKGAFEIAATVDYLFAFAATSRVVEDHHFDALYDAYLADDEVRGFIEHANPDALLEIAARFREAMERGLWRPRANDVHNRLAKLIEATT